MSTQEDYYNAVKRLIRQHETRPEGLPTATHIAKAVQDAVIEFSKIHPYKQVYDYDSDDGFDGSEYDFDLPTGMDVENGIDRILHDAIEYPTGNRPATILDAKDTELYLQSTGTYKLRFLNHTPASDETARVPYVTVHTVSSSTSTVPTKLEPAVHYKAAEICCYMMAATHTRDSDPAIDAIEVDHGSRAEQWRQLAEMFKTMYERYVGIGEDKTVKSGGAFFELDIRQPWGEERVTHPDDWF